MSKGIEAARAAGNATHADLVDDLKEQLLIVFLKRLGGSADIPCAEVDDTQHDLFSFSVDEHRVFHFEIRKKQ
jgi:hypothetical protein